MDYCWNLDVFHRQCRKSAGFRSFVNIFGAENPDFVIKAGVLEKYQGSSCEVVIPDTVSFIGEEAFRGCKGLRKVTIPNGVKEIGTNAFAECESLESIDIPNSVTELGVYTFAHCRNLTNVILPDNMEIKYLSGTFYGCHNLTNVKIPKGIETFNNTFEGCKSITNITIPNSVKSMEGTFKGCKNLKQIEIPDSIIEIANDAFYELTDVEVIASKEILKKFRHNLPKQKRKGLFS